MRETRTGKELVARMIHRNSPRVAQALFRWIVPIAPTLPRERSYLALKGAGIGADRDRMGV
jgi:transcriptional regulator with GAF, ATPase, and Fis domain